MIRLIQRKLIIPRGDTGSFSIPAIAAVSASDVAVFTIFDCLTRSKVYQKTITVTGDTLTIEFTHNDTVNLVPGKYVWDIKFYKNPVYADDELVNGEEIDSYYAGYKLPECEIRDTGDNLLMNSDAPAATLTPAQLDIISAALATIAANVDKTEANVAHYPVIRDEEWYVWDSEAEDYVATGVAANGIVGPQGNGISNAVLNVDYTLTITFDDGTSYTTPSIRGDSGVYYGTQEPTDPSINVWIDPSGVSWNETIKGEVISELSRNRVVSLNNTALTNSNVIEAVGTPVYIDNFAEYVDYNINTPGWYVFARIQAPESEEVGANTTVSGAAGYIATIGAHYIDVAVRFDVAAESQTVTIIWSTSPDTFIFKATDLAVRNLDYRTTFYIYDIAPYTTWTYTLTTDTTFVAGRRYFTLENGIYTEDTSWVAGDPIPADTYYKHASVTFSGMVQNVTYKCDEIIDCPQIYVLPEINDDIHGCWYEIRLRHNGSYSSTLQVPEGVKVATEHTQAETAGLNMVDLHYSNVGGVKLWRFLNTHSTIPA